MTSDKFVWKTHSHHQQKILHPSSTWKTWPPATRTRHHHRDLVTCCAVQTTAAGVVGQTTGVHGSVRDVCDLHGSVFVACAFQVKKKGHTKDDDDTEIWQRGTQCARSGVGRVHRPCACRSDVSAATRTRSQAVEHTGAGRGSGTRVWDRGLVKTTDSCHAPPQKKINTRGLHPQSSAAWLRGSWRARGWRMVARSCL